MQTGVPKPEENPSLNIDLKIQQLAISGNSLFVAEILFIEVKYCFNDNDLKFRVFVV